MHNIPEISVIVPVYNSEKYLSKTLESIAKQIFTNFEVIIINDGSTDGSIHIINEFCEKYFQFKCVNIKNSGVSAARNLGISIAKGKYLAFVDSDDFIAPNFLYELYNSIEENNADIACCNYYIHWEKYNISIPNPFALSDRVSRADKILNIMIKDIRVHFYLWNKLWKKSLFTDNNIKLPNMCFEDIVVATRLFYNAKKIVVKSDCLYFYTQHSDSLVNSISAKKFDDYMLAFASIRNFLEIRQDYKKYSLSYTVLGYKIFIINLKSLLDIHIKNKNFSNILSDIKNSFKQVSYIISSKFTPTQNIENSLIPINGETDNYVLNKFC